MILDACQRDFAIYFICWNKKKHPLWEEKLATIILHNNCISGSNFCHKKQERKKEQQWTMKTDHWRNSGL